MNTTTTLGRLDDGREFAYVTVTGELYDGRLTVWGTQKRTQKSRTDYQVQEAPTDGFPGRVWLLAKDCPEGTVYQTSLAADGHGSACTCDAGQVGRKTCCHVKALRFLLTDGALDPSQDDRPETPWPHPEMCHTD